MSRKRRKFVIDSDESDDDNSQTKAQSKSSPKAESAARKKLSSDSLSESSEEEEWTFDTESGKAPKKSKKDEKKEEKKATNSADSVSSADEGELTPSDQDSGSDDSGASDNFDDGLDENFIGDTEDRDKLMSMTEAEREELLFERMEKREQMKVRQAIQKKLKQEKKKKQMAKVEAERKKTEQEIKAATVRSQRERKPQKEDKGKGKAFEELKAKRQAHKDKQKNYTNSPDREPKLLLKTKDVYSDEDDDDKSGSASPSSDSESESDRAPSPVVLRFITGKADLSKIRLSRFKLEKWVHLPFFKEVISGCYIRIGIGEKLGRKVYRVAEIFDVVETSKEYSLGSCKTNLGLKVRHGIAESVYRLEFVSNQDFTDTEFQKWKNTMDDQSLSLPTVKHVANKVKEIDNALNHIFSESEIEKIVQEKDKFRKGPRNFAFAKSNMISAKFQAEMTGDTSEVEKLKADLEDLETEADRKSKQRNKGLNNISFINDKNRKSTTNRIEEVLRMEHEEKMTQAPSPFCRRSTVPVMVTPKHKNQDQIAEVQASSDLLEQLAKEREQADKLVKEEEEKKVVSKAVKKAKQIIDPFEMHNDCDIDIDIGPIDTPNCFVTPKAMPQKRGMDLTEYKRKSGLM